MTICFFMPIPDITLISVYHNWLSKRLLEENELITRALNPGVTWEWRAGDNTSADFADAIRENKFKIMRNPEREKWNNLGSHQHSSAINHCFREVKTRFVASLDGDCFIIRKNWIRDVTDHMQKKNLSFFGLSFHPKAYANYRYFPTEVLMVVDLEKIPIDTLDFMPRLTINEQGKVNWGTKDVSFENKPFVVRTGKRFIPLLASYAGRIKRTFDMRERKKSIGTVWDICYSIYEQYYEKVPVECVTPVYNPNSDLFYNQKVIPRLNAFIEGILPDHLCYIPKKRGFISDISFRELGYYDCAGQGWEEYLWRGRPFAVHLRGVKTYKRKRTPEEEVERVKHALDSIVSL